MLVPLLVLIDQGLSLLKASAKVIQAESFFGFMVGPAGKILGREVVESG